MSSVQVGAAPAVDVSSPRPAALADKARQAVAWTAGITIFQDVLQFGVTLTLTRLLPPDAYGKFTFVTTVIGFFTVFSFREILNYTLQVRSDDETHYQDHFTAGAVIQGTLFVLVNLMAFGIRYVPAYAPAAPLLHIMSLLLPLDLVSEFRVKMLERSLEWRRLRTLHAAGLTIGAALAVTMALSGFGAYSLLVPSLTMSLPFAYDLFITEKWRPTWEWRADRYAPARRFGLLRIGSGGVVSLSSFSEGLILTRAIGFGPLGVYNRALGLAALCCQRMASLLLNALYPVLTRVPIGSEQYRRASALIIRCLAWTVIPLAVGIGLTAEPVVRLLYGTQWLESVRLVPGALALGAILALVHTAYTLLLAHQRQRRCLTADVARLLGTLVVLVVALPWGIEAYLASLIALQSGILMLTLVWLHDDGAITTAGVTSALLPSAVASLAALVAVLGMSRVTGLAIGPPWTGFAAGGAFMAIYVVLLRVFCARSLYELACQLPRRNQLLTLLRFPQPA
jgi:O-antigen/teichoic acid export membrane protein